MPATVGGGFALSVAMAVASYTGRSVFESASDEPQHDRIAYKEEAKTRYRRPVNETINELGEGRGKMIVKPRALTVELTALSGIYGPGYDQRRKQRIKERYGIDIQQPYYVGTSAPGVE